MANQDFFKDIFNKLSTTEFDEVPVSVEVFVTEFLEHPPLSDNQYDIVKASTQIFSLETLTDLYGPQEAAERYKWTKTEVVCALGKGSGKDQMAKISCLYLIYQLLCLKSPQKYFKKPAADYIDIMNIAINADQASRVFFGPLVDMIKECAWFDGKYEARSKDVVFDKKIRLTSGHSESESLEGYNVIMVVLDEISGFAEESNTGNKKAKTASAIYKMHRGSVSSRFPGVGKVVLLSFPRYHDDFISKRYKAAVAEVDTEIVEHIFKLDPDLPDGMRENEFSIEFELDHIVRFARPNIWAIKRPTWEINPTKKIDDFTDDFFDDPGDALTRFAAMPTADTETAVFKNHQVIDETFAHENGVDNTGVFALGFEPQEDKTYYMHVDLAQKHDRCVVSMAHVENWKQVSIGGLHSETHPEIVVDAIRWWQPTKTQSVDFQDVIDYILAVRRRGFKIGLVTFDRWNSHDTRNHLEEQGIDTDNLSVGNDHYMDFKTVLHDRRLVGPDLEELRTELKELQWIKGKVDHPRSGYKDLSDGTCGAVYNAVSLTRKPEKRVVEARTYRDIKRAEREVRENRVSSRPGEVIRPPRASEVPDDVRRYLKITTR